MVETKEKNIGEKLAVLKTGGKQYLVREGETLDVELLDVEEGKEITFEEVLLTIINGNVKIGTPFIKNAKVTATDLGLQKGDKQIIFKYKAKKNYRVKTGHRQHYTRIKIEKITLA